MQLTDLLPLEKWTALEKEIVAKSGMDANIFGTDGIRITDYKEWANRLCPAIKAEPKGQSFICAVAHMNIAKMAENHGQPVIEECDAGLAKLVVPILVENQFIGSVGACGAILDDGEIDDFMINKTTGIEEETIAELAGDIPNVTSESIEALRDFIVTKINAIVEEYQRRQSTSKQSN